MPFLESDVTDPHTTLIVGDDPSVRHRWFDHVRLESPRGVDVISCYGTPDCTMRDVLERMLAETSGQQVWDAVGLYRLNSPPALKHQSAVELARWLNTCPEEVDEAFMAVDAAAAAEGYDKLLVFNDIDDLPAELIGGLLRFALEVRLSYRHLWAKVFLREDTLENADLAFTDSSKLYTNVVRLDGTVTR